MLGFNFHTIVAASAVLAGSVSATRGGKNDLKDGWELMTAECEFMDGFAYAWQYKRPHPKQAGKHQLSKPAPRIAVASMMDAATMEPLPYLDFDLGVRDFEDAATDWGWCSANIIEPLTSYMTDSNGSFYGRLSAKENMMTLFPEYDVFFGSDDGRQLSLDHLGLTYDCCTLTTMYQPDKLYLKKTLHKRYNRMRREID